MPSASEAPDILRGLWLFAGAARALHFVSDWGELLRTFIERGLSGMDLLLSRIMPAPGLSHAENNCRLRSYRRGERFRRAGARHATRSARARHHQSRHWPA